MTAFGAGGGAAFGGARFGAGRPDRARRMKARAAARRAARLREAKAVVGLLPGPGESVHLLMEGRYDLMHCLLAVLDGRPAEDVHIATLSFSVANLGEMLRLVDERKAGRLSLLCSAFFRDYQRDLWAEALARLGERGVRVAAARTHCKVIVARCRGADYVLEGSANLRSNSNVEQLAVFNDAALAAFHRGWITEMIDRHAGKDDGAI